MSERLPRATFSRRLERILDHVETTRSFAATWRDWFFHDQEAGTFRVVEVHVVGSFARGALECGDLDLVVAIDLVAGKRPPDRTISRLVSRGAARVQVHIGTPKENSSHASFPEAVLLWSTNDRNWRSRLASLSIDPTAGRFGRKTDRLPLRLAQMRIYDITHAENAVERIAAGELASQWHPLSAITPARESWPPNLAELMEGLRGKPGTDTARVLPFALQRLADLGVSSGPTWSDSMTAFTCGDVAVRIGKPSLDIRLLDELWANDPGGDRACHRRPSCRGR